MQIKKLSIIVLAVLLMASVMIPFVSADTETERALGIAVETNLSAAAPGLYNADQGDVFAFTVKLTENTGFIALQFDINYDPEALAVIGKDANGIIDIQNAASFVAVPGKLTGYANGGAVKEVKAGTVRANIIIDSRTPETYTGDLFTMYFKVLKIEHKAIDLGLSDIKAYDALTGTSVFTADEIEVAPFVLLGHGSSLSVAVVTEPTCLEGGFSTITCNAEGCEFVYIFAELEALGHDVVDDAAVAPKCTETGLTDGQHCARCGEVLKAQEEVSALGHDFNIVVTAPTCEEKGYTTRTCKVCGLKETYDEVAAAGHTPEEVPAVDATTFGEGKTAGTKCSVCGEMIKEPETVPALGIASAWWFWVIIAVVVIAIVAIIYNVVVLKKKKADKKA